LVFEKDAEQPRQLQQLPMAVCCVALELTRSPRHEVKARRSHARPDEELQHHS
jgi:hypothetical protein